MRLRLVLEEATHRIVVRRQLPPPFAGARIYTSTEGGLRYLARRMTQDYAPVEVLPVAVCNELSVARFHIARRNRATSHLDGFGTAMAGGVRATELVPTVTLDWLAARFPAPDVIKIDVEEAEMTVLTGGSRVLDRSPAIICEVAASNATPVWDLLNARGYAVYDGDRPRRERVPVAAAPPNTLAISS